MKKNQLMFFKVIRYKGIRDLHLSGLKRVNLITGENNIGKTSVLEAIFINANSESIDGTLSAIASIGVSRNSKVALPEHHKKIMVNGRNFKTDFTLLISPLHLESNCYNSVLFYREHSGDVEVTLTETEYENFVYKALKGVPNGLLYSYAGFMSYNKSLLVALEMDKIKDIFNTVDNVKFLNTLGWSDQEIVRTYSQIAIEDNEELVNESLNMIGVEGNFKVIGQRPKISTIGTRRDVILNYLQSKNYYHVSTLGYGTSQLINIVIGIINCQNGIMLIDDIEAGIYFNKYDRLWEVILTLSEKMNCQLFITTYSKEVIESFARVSKRLDAQDISYILLVKNKKRELKSISLEFSDIMESVVNQGHEIR